MPQLDFSTLAPQLVWLAITFVIFYLIMAKVALPRIATVIEQRRDRIARDLEEAERSRKDSEAAVAAYETALAEARSKAHEIASANRDKLTAELDRERAAVEQVATEKAAEADASIAAAKSAAIGELDAVVSEVTEAIVTELVGGRWPKDKIEKAVNAAIRG